MTPTDPPGKMEHEAFRALLVREFDRRGIPLHLTGCEVRYDVAAYGLSRPWGVFLKTLERVCAAQGHTEEDALREAFRLLPVPAPR